MELTTDTERHPMKSLATLISSSILTAVVLVATNAGAGELTGSVQTVANVSSGSIGESALSFSDRYRAQDHDRSEGMHDHLTSLLLTSPVTYKAQAQHQITATEHAFLFMELGEYKQSRNDYLRAAGSSEPLGVTTGVGFRF